METSISNETCAEEVDHWERIRREGEVVISKLWWKLLPGTRSSMLGPNYDGIIGYQRWKDLFAYRRYDDMYNELNHIFDKIEYIEYSIGIINEASESSIPKKRGDKIHWVFQGEEIISEIRNLLSNPEGQDPEFAEIAVNALIKRQTCATFVIADRCGYVETSKHPVLKSLIKLSFIVIFGIFLPFSIGEGLAFAFRGDGLSASLCTLVALFSYTYLRESYKEKSKPEFVAYQRWRSLQSPYYGDSHIGTGHGILVKLKEMIHHGIHVPTILIDLCVILNRRWRIGND